jgi:hypothetical protein
LAAKQVASVIMAVLSLACYCIGGSTRRGTKAGARAPHACLVATLLSSSTVITSSRRPPHHPTTHRARDRRPLRSSARALSAPHGPQIALVVAPDGWSWLQTLLRIIPRPPAVCCSGLLPDQWHGRLVEKLCFVSVTILLHCVCAKAKPP